MQGSRSFVTAVMLLGLSAAATAQQEWEVVWEDGFSGSEIDPANWEHMIGDGTAYGLPSGWGNNELQYYTDRPENSFVSFGYLQIVAKRENYGGKAYTSARLRTRGLQDFQYGRLEARIQVPYGQGIWPAFWMLPTDSQYGGWAAGGEIDIFETINIPTEVYGTIHFGGEWPNNTQNGRSFSIGEDLSRDFHVYAIEWEPDRITWSIDGIEYHSVPSSRWWSENGNGNDLAPFDQPFHFLLNIAVGGNWPGPPDGTTVFPQTMLVDWVRVSKPRQAPYGGEPHPIPGRVEAEVFDEGVAEQAYFDTDAGNNGGEFRPDSDVDIETCSEGGFNLGWIREGEWVEYTVDVKQSGSYELLVRVSSPLGGRLALEVDGVDRTGEVAVPATGGWQNWTTASRAGVWLARGERVIRIANRGGAAEDYNINWFELRPKRPAIRSIMPRP